MEEFLAHPWVQGGLAPLACGLVATLVLSPLRLSGLAAACGFFAAVYLTGYLELEKKLVLVALAAALLGALADLAFRPTRMAGIVLGIVFGSAAFWLFLATIGYMPAQRLVSYAVGMTALVAASVAFSVLSQDEAPRAGAAGVGLGAAVGVLALLGGAQLLALWSFGLAAGAAGFLIATMVLGGRVTAGASLTLSTGAIGALMALAVTLQRNLAWYDAALLAFVPLAVRLPVPRRGMAAQAIAALAYALAAGGGVCALVWLR